MNTAVSAFSSLLFQAVKQGATTPRVPPNAGRGAPRESATQWTGRATRASTIGQETSVKVGIVTKSSSFSYLLPVSVRRYTSVSSF